jgi:hypothetical protein
VADALSQAARHVEFGRNIRTLPAFVQNLMLFCPKIALPREQMKTAAARGSTSVDPLLLKQFKLLCAVIDAPWATRLDHKIARHIIDRCFAKVCVLSFDGHRRWPPNNESHHRRAYASAILYAPAILLLKVLTVAGTGLDNCELLRSVVSKRCTSRCLSAHPMGGGKFCPTESPRTPRRSTFQ